MSVVAFPRHRVQPPAPPPLSARQVVAFPGRRFPAIEVAPEGGPAPRVVAPRRVVSVGRQRQRQRLGTVVVSAVLHLALVGLALGTTTGALSSGDGGVLQVTLVASLPPSPAATGPVVPTVVQPTPVAPREDRAVVAPRADTAVAQAVVARPVAPVADAPAQAVPLPPVPGLLAAVGQVAAPPDAEGTLPPLPGDATAPAQSVVTALPVPHVAEAEPVADAAPPPPKPRAARPKPTVAQAGGKARGAGAGAAAGTGGQAAMTATGPAEAAAMAGWGARIMAGVERHKHYPVAAGDARGTVGVALTLGREGQLVAASVAQSSGVAALDLAAVAAVRAAAPFPAAPDALTAARYGFTLRVKFGG